MKLRTLDTQAGMVLHSLHSGCTPQPLDLEMARRISLHLLNMENSVLKRLVVKHGTLTKRREFSGSGI
jgi:hypothetical protein